MNLENKKILVAHGDSFTRGSGFPVIDGKHQRIDIEKPWPKLLAKDLGMECINFGKEGVSNGGIARDLLCYLSQTKENFEDLFLVVGWTNYIREEFYNDKINGWDATSDFSNLTLKDYVTFWKTDENDYRKTMINKLAIQNYLKLHNIPYLFFDTFKDRLDAKDGWIYENIIDGVHTICDIIESNSYFPLNEMENKLIDHELYCDTVFWDEIEEMGWDYSFMPDDGHPNEKGHEHWTNYLKEVIDGA